MIGYGTVKIFWKLHLLNEEVEAGLQLRLTKKPKQNVRNYVIVFLCSQTGVEAIAKLPECLMFVKKFCLTKLDCLA